MHRFGPTISGGALPRYKAFGPNFHQPGETVFNSKRPVLLSFWGRLEIGERTK
jgi:hypothetical protein